MSYIVLAIPIFFLLIGIEVLLDKLKKTGHYRFNDAVTNISCGLGQQVTGVFLKTATIIGYIWLYENMRITTMPHFNGDWSTPVLIVTWIVLFIGVDFFYYWFHRLAHEISVLWGSHIVHHQSEEYNLTVALRQSWVQGAFSWVFYLPLAVLGFEPIMFLAVNQFQTLYQFWIHTRTINKMHPAFEYVFNTPSHHRVHHGVNPQYIDKNHGGTLIIFDRMFGTFQPEEEEVVYGITTGTHSWNPLWVNFQYWIDLFKEVAQVPGWGNKLKMLYHKPGWKPDFLGGPVPLKSVTPQTFIKYDTQTPLALNYYVLFQYVVILSGSSIFLFLEPELTWGLKSILAALIVWSIVNLGGIFEKRRWTFFLEMIRITVVAVVFLWLFRENELYSVIIAANLAFVVLSVFWLAPYRESYFLQKDEDFPVDQVGNL